MAKLQSVEKAQIAAEMRELFGSDVADVEGLFEGRRKAVIESAMLRGLKCRDSRFAFYWDPQFGYARAVVQDAVQDAVCVGALLFITFLIEMSGKMPGFTFPYLTVAFMGILVCWALRLGLEDNCRRRRMRPIGARTRKAWRQWVAFIEDTYAFINPDDYEGVKYVIYSLKKHIDEERRHVSEQIAEAREETESERASAVALLARLNASSPGSEADQLLRQARVHSVEQIIVKFESMLADLDSQEADLEEATTPLLEAIERLRESLRLGHEVAAITESGAQTLRLDVEIDSIRQALGDLCVLTYRSAAQFVAIHQIVDCMNSAREQLLDEERR